MTYCFKVSPRGGFLFRQVSLAGIFLGGNCHPTFGYFQWSVPQNLKVTNIVYTFLRPSMDMPLTRRWFLGESATL